MVWWRWWTLIVEVMEQRTARNESCRSIPQDFWDLFEVDGVLDFSQREIEWVKLELRTNKSCEFFENSVESIYRSHFQHIDSCEHLPTTSDLLPAIKTIVSVIAYTGMYIADGGSIVVERPSKRVCAVCAFFLSLLFLHSSTTHIE